MDQLYAKLSKGNVGELPFLSPFLLKRMPSEYWQTNCWVGASFMTRQDCLDRKAVGVDRIMWGSDFPHSEGTFPHTAEALAHTFAGVSESEASQMLGRTATDLYGFDFGALKPLAEQFGPSVQSVAAGIDELTESTSPAFEEPTAGVR